MDNGKNEVFLWVAECWKANVGTQKGKGLKRECKSLCVCFSSGIGEGGGGLRLVVLGMKHLICFSFHIL